MIGFYVISAKLAKQASERFAAETGWLVLNLRGAIVYRMRLKSDAVAACERLNVAAG